MSITTKEAAERLGVIPRRVVALIHAGRIEAEKRGHDWWVDEASVAAYAATERKPGQPRKA